MRQRVGTELEMHDLLVVPAAFKCCTASPANADHNPFPFVAAEVVDAPIHGLGVEARDKEHAVTNAPLTTATNASEWSWC